MYRIYLALQAVIFIALGFGGMSTALAASKPTISSISPQQATASGQVTISGKNFGSNTGKAAVQFGTNAATIQAWGSSKIVAKSPVGTGTVQVKVVNSKGLGSNGVSFKYLTPPEATTGLTGFKVFSNNDLGMHCVDKDFSVFSILPPFNVVNAQVIAQDSQGKPVLLGTDKVFLRYSPIADASNSINSTSKNKTNFWQYAGPLFGVNLDPRGQGLKGLYMPADAPGLAQTQFGWDSGLGLFSAPGIPIIPTDDAGKSNKYPLMRVTAFDKSTNRQLGYSDVVLPVSDETTCSNCHATGKQAADPNSQVHQDWAGVQWSGNPDLEVQSRTNVLILHDLNHGTQLQNSQPVLCASCHYTPALDLAGSGPVGDQVGKLQMSQTMHRYHAAFNQVDGKPLYDAPAPVAGLAASLKGVPPADQQTCYQCHPGNDTKCLRGAMTETVTCQNCHGGMSAVGGAVAMKGYGPSDGRLNLLNRHPWSDEPRCQSCHTGDAVSHLTPGVSAITDPATLQTKTLDNQLAADGLRLMLSFDKQDPAASPLLASNKRFAENDGKLFRFSKGHGGLACEACHGSTHAIWPGDSAHPNDNVAAVGLQGHMGVIAECTTCHKSGTLAMNLNGPHGLHPVNNASWHSENGHAKLYKQNANSCKTCHGADLKGTALSRAASDRSYQTEWGTKTVSKGQAVNCWTCHNGPNGD